MSNDTLAHYGVPGMRWGVRKKVANSVEKAPKKKMTPEQKRIAKNIAIGAGIVAAAAVTTYAVTRNPKVDYQKIQDLIRDHRSITVPANSAFQNVNYFGQGLNTDKTIFTTYKAKDRIDHGRKFTEELFRRNGGNGPVYNTVLRSKQPIKAPSNKVAEKLYRDYLKENGASTANIKRQYANLHRGFGARGFNSGESLHPFLQYVQGKGYNAIQDVVDQRSGHYRTSAPLIIFNGRDNLTTIGEYVMRYGRAQLSIAS